MEIVQSEVFGPFLTRQTFAGEDEVVQLANGTKYGLAAMVFTRNEARAWRVSGSSGAASSILGATSSGFWWPSFVGP